LFFLFPHTSPLWKEIMGGGGVYVHRSRAMDFICVNGCVVAVVVVGELQLSLYFHCSCSSSSPSTGRGAIAVWMELIDLFPARRYSLLGGGGGIRPESAHILLRKVVGGWGCGGGVEESGLPPTTVAVGFCCRKSRLKADLNSYYASVSFQRPCNIGWEGWVCCGGHPNAYPQPNRTIET